MTDKTLTCVDCKKAFIFEDGEQQFFALKGLTDPKRCKPCRTKAKAKREGSHPQPVRSTDIPYRHSDADDAENG